MTQALIPIKHKRMSDEVRVQLARRIVDGTYPAGSRLPSERELALMLGVTRTTLREALRGMEGMGLVTVRPGDGIHVRDHRLDTGIEFALFLFREGLALDPELMRSIADARRAFVRAMIEALVGRGDAAAVARLEGAVARYQEAVTQGPLTGAADFEFFRAVAQASGNQVYVYLLNTLREVIEQAAVVYGRLQGSPAVACAFYASLVEAVRAGDATRALALVDERMDDDDARLARLMGRGREVGR